MKNLKILLSLIDYLNEFLPFDYDKEFLDKEVLAFLRLYQKLGGETIKTAYGIEISESFEITLRLLNGEKVVLKKKQKGIVMIGYPIKSREQIIAGITKISIPEEFFIEEDKELYPGFGEVGFKNKNRTGSKIPKQKQIRRR